MKIPAPHLTLLALSASLVLLTASRIVVADEPLDPADDGLPAMTDNSLSDEPVGDEPSADERPDSTAVTAGAENGAEEDGRPAVSDPPVEEIAPVRVAGPANAGRTTPETEPGTAPESGLAIDMLEPEGTRPQPDPAVDSLADEPGGRLPEALLEAAPSLRLAAAATVADEATSRTLTMLNADVLPGSYQRLSWSATEMFEDLPVATPVLVVNGRSSGPILCLTAAVHGDELNGIEMVRRVMHDLDPKTLSGAVVGVPIVNLQGFRRGSRYLPDRRDLNRYFPGNPRGSAASRIAHSFFTEVIEHCDALVDLHTGSFDRANLPQLRADLRNPDVVTLTHGFGATVILHSEPAEGTLRHAATSAGIPTVTLEAGGPSELELKEVMHGVKGIETLLNTLGMVARVRLWGDQQPVYYRSSWVRANRGGILLADVTLGSTVRRGDLLGTITDPMNNASTNLYSPYSGRVIGMARNQVVMPGFAAFHVGIQAVDTRAEESGQPTPDPEAEEEQDDETLAREESEAGKGDYVDGMSE